MDLYYIKIALVLCMLIGGSHSQSLWEHQPPALAAAENSFSVMDFGAAGDGKKDDSQAFVKAWQATCGSSSKQSTLIVPAGKKFLLKTVTFQGPCKSPSVNVQVLSNIIAPPRTYFGSNMLNWIVFTNVNGLIVNGNGQIDGNGASWWSTCVKDCQSPPSLLFNECTNLQLSGLTLINSPRNHISITDCMTSTIFNLHITAPKDSPYTDGIDIGGSKNIQIRDSIIGTGDDCIAINNGSSYINITNINCGPGHGISIGSLGSNGTTGLVEQVHVSKCTFTGTQNGARIKTYQGGSGFARSITYKDITLNGVGNPIFIDQYYCPVGTCKPQASAVAISDVSFSGFHGTSASAAAVQLNCSQSVGCTKIKLDHINITATPEVYATCVNAHGTSSPSNIPSVPCLITF